MKPKYLMFIRFLLLFLWMGLIFYFSHQDAGVSSTQSEGLLYYVNSFLRSTLNIEITDGIIRKTAHFVIYLVLGILAENSLGRLNRINFWTVFAFCVIYAASDEVHQTFVSGRAGMTADVLLDSLGSLFGMMIFRITKKGIEEK